MDIILPKSPILADRVNPKLALFYGPPKVGKTTKVTELKNYLLLDIEDNSGYVDAVKIVVKNYEHLKQIHQQIKKENKPYRVLVYDTIDKIESWLEKEATITYKTSAMGKTFTGDSVLLLPNGAGYQWLRNAFDKFLEEINGLADYIIFIGHIREKFSDTVAGKQVVSSKDLDLTGKVRNIICAKANVIGTVYRDTLNKGLLSVSFKTAEAVNCGTHCQHLKGKEIPFDWKLIYLNEPEITG